MGCRRIVVALNDSGRLGNNTNVASTLAVVVKRSPTATLDVVTAVSAGWRHSCAVTLGGSAWCWGLNGDGRLGNGHTEEDRMVAVRVRA